MESAARHELEELRARAYGPSADIHTDPDALERLRELEARRAPAPDTSAPDDAYPIDHDPIEHHPIAHHPIDQNPIDDDPDAPATAPPEGEDAAADGDPPRTSSPWRVSRRIGVLWIASIVAVTGVTYAFASIPSVSPMTGAHQVATLEPVPDFEMPEFFGSDQEITGFDDFYGLTAFHGGPGFFGYTPDQQCFAVGLTADLEPGKESLTGPIYSGCSAGAFPATIQIAVDDSMPDALRERFPEDSAIQFVLDGDRVGVFSDENLP